MKNCLELYNNFAWYITDNRFQDIVNELEQKANELNTFIFDTSDEEGNQEFKKKYHSFRKVVLYHATTSGYSKKHPEVLNVNKFFFIGNRINNKTLKNFEKDIVKNHMYQKHLWDFMGTTGHLSLVSKLALAKNGKGLDDITPILGQDTRSQASPIASILNQTPNSVPLYLYSDGTASTLYDKNKAKLSFCTTSDKSGFDWKHIGYDPNFSVENNDLKIVYDPKTGEYKFAEISEGLPISQVVQIFIPEKASQLSVKVILSENGDGAILDDPFYIFIYKSLYDIILQNKKLTDEQEDYRNELLSLIDKSLNVIGANKITKIVRSRDNSEQVSDAQVIKAYHEVLGSRLASNVRLITADDAAAEQSKSLNKTIKRHDEQAGMNLANKLSHLVSLGFEGFALSKAIKTLIAPQNANFLETQDLKHVGFSEKEANEIIKFEIPKDKQQIFSKVLFNIMEDYSLFASSGFSKKQIADMVYNDVVNGAKNNEYIEIQITLEQLCTTKSTMFDSEIQPGIRMIFEDALVALPNKKRTKHLEDMVNNAILRYKVIKESSALTESQIVLKLAELNDSSKPSIISYVSTPNPNLQKLTIRLKFSEIVDKVLKSNKFIKFEKPIDFTNMPTKSCHNLFKTADIIKWLNSPVGKKSGLDVEAITDLGLHVRKSSLISQSSFVNRPSFDYTELQPILLNNVTADLSQFTQFVTSNLNASQINPVLLGLPLLSEGNKSLSSSLVAINSSSIQNYYDKTNSLQTNLNSRNNQDIVGISQEFAYKTEDETPQPPDNSSTDSNNTKKENTTESQNNPSQPPEEKSPEEKKGISDSLKYGLIGIGVAAGVGAAGVGGYFLYKCLKNKKSSQLPKLLDHDSIMQKMNNYLDNYEKMVNECKIDYDFKDMMEIDFNKLIRYLANNIINSEESKGLWNRFIELDNTYEKNKIKCGKENIINRWNEAVKLQYRQPEVSVKSSSAMDESMHITNDLNHVNNEINNTKKSNKKPKHVGFFNCEVIDFKKGPKQTFDLDDFKEYWDEIGKANLKNNRVSFLGEDPESPKEPQLESQAGQPQTRKTLRQKYKEKKAFREKLKAGSQNITGTAPVGSI